MPVDDATFVPLATLLRPERAVDDDPPATAVTCADTPAETAIDDRALVDVSAELARDVRLFRARLADAFAAVRDALLRELAYAVLGRELLLADADVAAIAARILAEHAPAQPLRIRIAPSDVLALGPQADALPPFVCDAALASGDAIVELTSGTVDARLGVRLAAILDASA